MALSRLPLSVHSLSAPPTHHHHYTTPPHRLSSPSAAPPSEFVDVRCICLDLSRYAYSLRMRLMFLICVSNAWHLNYIGPADSAQALPNDLRNYFPGGGVSTWILIRHGFRVWPIEVVNFQFGEGWDTFSETHNLKFGIKITMPCQRKWIFHTAIFDESDQELVYRWAGPNLQWREFHYPPVNLRIAFLPFTFAKEQTMLKFGSSPLELELLPSTRLPNLVHTSAVLLFATATLLVV
ncbi:hypothetical protein RHMOL_Rhmol06G0033700 [Rhododendron molle]|uniref:Uncharacterized protein n=1 Tax=Rhododendron molle TaxID=49168 RepID=A0ACC0N901_RHOML|nr:hypothetical protein RHMOL_Rhmol06G0033700 [Rhododendron molle]